MNDDEKRLYNIEHQVKDILEKNISDEEKIKRIISDVINVNRRVEELERVRASTTPIIERLHSDMQDIKKIISNIRNWAIGGFVFFIFDRLGLIHVVEKIFF